MNKTKIISIVVGAIGLLAALFFGVNINGEKNTNQRFVGNEAMQQLMTTSNLAGNLTNQNYTVYVTKSGKKYHTENCRYVLGKRIPINRLDAIDSGYEPCKRCYPDGKNTPPIPQQQNERQSETQPPQSTTPMDEPIGE
ncbi:MAG TPA: hypothetical protein PLC91_00970 [Candidatus Cloacimonadota bacterium]|nr:hypothetical protein [Candidatus Cloacimonadota bacterium]HQH50511.1 hypothetical protein [Candidatus Cloacimonadota bacterium]